MKSIFDWLVGKKGKTGKATNVTVEKPVAPSLELRQFTSEFFATFGAEIKALDRRKSGPVQITLSPALAEHFKTEQLLLAFQTADLQAGYELIAYGSRTFDQMLGWLERRAAHTVQKLPIREQSSDLLLQAIRPLNASIHNLKLHEQLQFLFAFDWRITYRADDKREELYTVVLDESGARLKAREDSPPANHTSPGAGIDLPTLLIDAEPVALETNEEGLQLPPKLPPITQMTRLAETARKYATYHADVRCINHEAEILPRLYKSLNRLTSYYQQQLEELVDAHDSDGEKRRGLEDDLRRKLAEEVENHRLRVQVDLIGYVALQVPVAAADITLSDGKREATVRVHRNRYTGALRRPTCHACGQEIEQVVLDRNGQISCDACADQCQTCNELVSGADSTHLCPLCDKRNCTTCSAACAACGEYACTGCISRCSVCGDLVCHACQTECSHCGKRQCRSHLRSDAVAVAGAQAGAPALICPDCTIRCPDCQQYSAQIETCVASGQRFCRNCTVHCTRCDRPLGKAFAQISPIDKRPYCPECAALLSGNR